MTSVAQIIRDFTVALAEPHDATKPGSSKTLVASIAGSSLVFVSGAVVNVALSAIGHDMKLDAAQIQWLVNAELLPLAALSMVGGSLGDRFGRKRMFILGMAVFLGASLMAARSDHWTTLLISRLLQGTSNALILPNGLTIIGQAFPMESKSKAVGIWSGSIAIASAFAPALAGFLLVHFTWRSVFLLNIPIVLLAILCSAHWIPKDDALTDKKVDIAAAGISTLSLGALGWALTVLSNGVGGLALPLAAVIVSAVGVFVLIAEERKRGDDAMLPPALFSSTTIVGINVFTVLLYGALSVILTVVPYAIIRGAGQSAIIAGAAFIPLQVLMALISPLAPVICDRIGHRYPLVIGAVVTAAGCALGGGALPSTDYWSGFFPGILLISFGLSIAIAPLTTLVLTSVGEAYSGIAAGFNGATSRVGSLIAVALLGGVLRHSGPSLIEYMHKTMLVCAVVCILAALSVLLLIPKPNAS
jgi:MFS family permease